VFMGSWFRWRSWLRGGGGSGPAAQPGGPVDAVEVHQLGGRVGGAHAAGPGAHHHLALAVAGGVQPVGHAGVSLAITRVTLPSGFLAQMRLLVWMRKFT